MHELGLSSHTSLALSPGSPLDTGLSLNPSGSLDPSLTLRSCHPLKPSHSLESGNTLVTYWTFLTLYSRGPLDTCSTNTCISLSSRLA